jgi:hypothetical protein
MLPAADAPVDRFKQSKPPFTSSAASSIWKITILIFTPASVV